MKSLSTPSSSNYGKWLTVDEITSKIAPSADNVRSVVDFLATFGVTGNAVRLSKFHDKIHVTMTADVAAKVLDTEFARFRSVTERSLTLLRITKPYSLPTEIANVVHLVDDILRFPNVKTPLTSYGAEPLNADSEFSSCGSGCSGMTTPDVISAAYGLEFPVKNVVAGNSISVAEFQYQYYDLADLNNFDTACGTKIEITATVGGNKESVCNIGCVEALLDIEYAGALTYPIPFTVIYQQDFSLLNWVDSVISMENPPLVHSVSYGNDEVQQTSVEYMESCNTQFMMAGSMGLSILFASGDQGVWGRTGVGKEFHPDFPASSPYVTAVGGTNFAEKSTIGAETTWNCGGGGFSDTFPIPSFQTDAVANYLKIAGDAGLLPDASFFNSSGRAYPDISALGGQTNPYCVSVGGGSRFEGVAGTSASCPVAASIFAQLNNVRLSNGKSSLGWLNPLIYSNSNCFADVNDGSMNNCNPGTQGFKALDGMYYQ